MGELCEQQDVHRLQCWPGPDLDVGRGDVRGPTGNHQRNVAQCAVPPDKKICLEHGGPRVGVGHGATLEQSVGLEDITVPVYDLGRAQAERARQILYVPEWGEPALAGALQKPLPAVLFLVVRGDVFEHVQGLGAVVARLAVEL